MGGIEPFIALQTNEIGLQGIGHHFGNFSFAHAGQSLYKQGLFSCSDRNTDMATDLVCDVTLLLKHGLYLCELKIT